MSNKPFQTYLCPGVDLEEMPEVSRGSYCQLTFPGIFPFSPRTQRVPEGFPETLWSRGFQAPSLELIGFQETLQPSHIPPAYA